MGRDSSRAVPSADPGAVPRKTQIALKLEGVARVQKRSTARGRTELPGSSVSRGLQTVLHYDGAPAQRDEFLVPSARAGWGDAYASTCASRRPSANRSSTAQSRADARADTPFSRNRRGMSSSITCLRHPEYSESPRPSPPQRRRSTHRGRRELDDAEPGTSGPSRNRTARCRRGRSARVPLPLHHFAPGEGPGDDCIRRGGSRCSGGAAAAADIARSIGKLASPGGSRPDRSPHRGRCRPVGRNR